MALVSVVMPVYNGEVYLEAAVRSVLSQTMTDLELIVVDDGSSDRSVEILQRLASEDPRIRIDQLPVNRGHHVASNRALELATGKYIVRHDQDDILMPDWVSHSVEHLDSHAEVGLLSGSYRYLEGASLSPLHIPPLGHTAIRANLIFRNVICHPGVVTRSDLRDTGELAYHDFAGPQDYDLWVRLFGVTRGVTLPYQAVLYRRHPTTMSAAFESEMPSEVERISNRQIRELLGTSALSDDDLRAVRRLWSAQQVTKADLLYASTIAEVLTSLSHEPFIVQSELGQVRLSWARRVLSRSARARILPGERFFANELGAALRWKVRGASTMVGIGQTHATDAETSQFAGRRASPNEG